LTLLPCEAQRISYAESPWDYYELPYECARPNCRAPGVHAHHIVRRSYTQGVGPQDWIGIDGGAVPNKVGLCPYHHEEITTNQTRIVWLNGRFCWAERDALEDWVARSPLSPVPLDESPVPPSSPGGALVEREHDTEGGSDSSSRSTLSDDGGPATPEENDAPTSVLLSSEPQEGQSLTAGYELSPAPGPPEITTALPEGDVTESGSGREAGKPGVGTRPPSGSAVCPACKRKLPKPKSEQEPTRPKVTWSVKVPKDHREDGYELLKTLVEQCQEQLSREGEPPYYALVEVMYAFLTSAKERAA
jgi:hypothetical protein